MKRIVCYSGGHSSALAAIETIKRYGTEGVVLLNHDISPHVEHQDIKRFKQEVATYLGVKITYANMDGWESTPPLAVAIKNRAFKAYNSPALCTARLKTEPFYKWLAKHGETGDEVIYGFDSCETQRMKRRLAVLGAMGYKTVFPLAEWKRTVLATEEIKIARPVTYQTYKHANCIGCLKAGRQHWYCVYCLRPDIWGEAKEAEAIIGHSIIKGAYLEDLEPKFQEMRDKLHITPTDKTESAKFWANVRKALPEDADAPCDCISD